MTPEEIQRMRQQQEWVALHRQASLVTNPRWSFPSDIISMRMKHGHDLLRQAIRIRDMKRK